MLERLRASRVALLAALAGVTERDFAAELPDGRSVVRALAELAAAERGEVAAARGREARARIPEKPLPPQVMHDLAGARYETEQLLEEGGPTPPGPLEALVKRVTTREAAVAAAVGGRPRA
ncbi:MAG: hypothetical protein FJZ92_01820 [Chloroflexi bacterium]|nr:hypothetical protein [Chloroflexota bacterium]